MLRERRHKRNGGLDEKFEGRDLVVRDLDVVAVDGKAGRGEVLAACNRVCERGGCGVNDGFGIIVVSVVVFHVEGFDGAQRGLAVEVLQQVDGL